MKFYCVEVPRHFDQPATSILFNVSWHTNLVKARKEAVFHARRLRGEQANLNRDHVRVWCCEMKDRSGKAAILWGLKFAALPEVWGVLVAKVRVRGGKKS